MMYQAYKIVDGDTLESLADRVNISCDEILRLNGMDISDFASGNFIVLPTNNYYYKYIVKPGDSLYGISKKNNIDLRTLYAINGLDDGDYIYPYQEILIPNDNFLIYLTQQDESIGSIAEKMGINESELLRYISKLYMLPDQLIVYKRD